MYCYCPHCGRLHDDGTIIKEGEKTLFICFECSEKLEQKLRYQSDEEGEK